MRGIRIPEDVDAVESDTRIGFPVSVIPPLGIFPAVQNAVAIGVEVARWAGRRRRHRSARPERGLHGNRLGGVLGLDPDRVLVLNLGMGSEADRIALAVPRLIRAGIERSHEGP